MINYTALRASDRMTYLRSHGWFDLLGWFPFADQDTFDRVHARSLCEMSARGIYSASSATDSVIEEILSVVISGLFPAASPFSGLIADAIVFIVKMIATTVEGLFKAARARAEATQLMLSAGFEANQMAAWSAEASAA